MDHESERADILASFARSSSHQMTCVLFPHNLLHGTWAHRILQKKDKQDFGPTDGAENRKNYSPFMRIFRCRKTVESKIFGLSRVFLHCCNTSKNKICPIPFEWNLHVDNCSVIAYMTNRWRLLKPCSTELGVVHSIIWKNRNVSRSCVKKDGIISEKLYLLCETVLATDFSMLQLEIFIYDDETSFIMINLIILK